MSKVLISGVAMTAFGKFLDRSVRSLAQEAADAALERGGPRVCPPGLDAFNYASGYVEDDPLPLTLAMIDELIAGLAVGEEAVLEPALLDEVLDEEQPENANDHGDDKPGPRHDGIVVLLFAPAGGPLALFAGDRLVCCGRNGHLDLVRRPLARAGTGASLSVVARYAAHRRHLLDRPPGGHQKRMNVLQALNPPVRRRRGHEPSRISPACRNGNAQCGDSAWFRALWQSHPLYVIYGPG